MSIELYLDSARLGLMPPRAQRAHHDFVRLAAKEGASATVVDLLRGGFDCWPREFRRRYPDLGDWRGIGPLMQSVRALAGAPPAAEVFLATHSAPLMGLAARLLCRSCRVIVHTDLEWPPYIEILRAEARRQGRRLVLVPVRDLLPGNREWGDEIISYIVATYRQSGADGLFLTEVTHDGIRLPLARVVNALGLSGSSRFIVVDAAQALGHTPLDLESGPGDLYLAGCHKWIGSGLPLSLAIAPRGRTREQVREVADRLIAARHLDDPLLRLMKSLSAGILDGHGETVNLAPLISASAAISYHLGRADSAARRFEQRVVNASTLSVVASEWGWEPLLSPREYRSGILILRAKIEEARSEDADRLRGRFRRRGVSLSAYPNGILRASLPDRGWTDDGLGAICSAFLGVHEDLTRKGPRLCDGGNGVRVLAMQHTPRTLERRG